MTGTARRLGLESHLERAVRTLGPRTWRGYLREAEQFRRLCALCMRPDSNYVDIGANRGETLRPVVGLAPRGHHLAYEPIPALADELGRAFPAVEVRRVALSDRRGTERFAWVRDLPSRSGLDPLYHSPDEVETIEVPVERLDDSLPGGYVPTLIKIDVEGAERQVLAGAMRTITLHEPIVVFEHDPDAAGYYGTRTRDLHELLCADAGLRLFGIDGAGPYSITEFEEAVGTRRRWNFVAHA